MFTSKTAILVTNCPQTIAVIVKRLDRALEAELDGLTYVTPPATRAALQSQRSARRGHPAAACVGSCHQLSCATPSTCLNEGIIYRTSHPKAS